MEAKGDKKKKVYGSIDVAFFIIGVILTWWVISKIKGINKELGLMISLFGIALTLKSFNSERTMMNTKKTLRTFKIID